MMENSKSTWGCLATLILIGAVGYGLVILYSLVMQEIMMVDIREGKSSYAEYLEKYPEGRYARKAENHILSQLDHQTWDEEYYVYTLESEKENYAGLPLENRIDSLLNARITRDYKKAELKGTIAGWNEYKQKLPKRYWRDAEDRIAELEQALWGTEEAAWKSAQEENTLNAFNKYLELYPKGRHARAADKKVIDFAVADAFSREHGELPALNKEYSNNSGKNEVTARNDTEYTLTILYSGPVNSYRQVIKAKETGKIVLTNGKYRIVASVDNPSVRSYAGTMTMDGGGYYSSYYIFSFPIRF